MATTIDDQLRAAAADLARRYGAGEITLDQLRAVWQQLLSNAVTIAFLSGTGGQRNAEIDAKLRELIQRDSNELDRLISLIERSGGLDRDSIRERLGAFADNLDNIQAEGERLVQQPDFRPLAIIGGALAALLIRQRTPGRVILPDAQSLVRHFEMSIDNLSAQAGQGIITQERWLELMRNEIRNMHAALYRSGLQGEFSASDLERLNARIQAQWDFLDGFAEDIRAGKLTPEQIQRRARMYLENGQASLQEGAAARLGFTLPAYPKDGTTECLSNCRCYWNIQEVEGGFDCTWTQRPAEHCPTCVVRADVWAPIQVRNGIVGPYSVIGTFA